MRVGLLCLNLRNDSGAGLDVYSYNLVSSLAGKVQFFPVEQGFHSNLGWVLGEFVVPRYLIQVAKTEADVYHAVSPFGARSAVLARKTPLVATIHDLIPNDCPLSPDYYEIHHARRRWLNPWYWRFLRKCDRLIATSESTKEDAVRILKVEPDKVSVVHYSVDTRRFQPTLRDDYHSPKTVLYLGALDQGKGIFNLMRAFHMVTKRIEDIRLIVGGKGPALPSLIALSRELGIAGQVKFLGFVPEEKLAECYDSSDIFVFPSYLGFHLMFLDAMASGLPVIAGNVRDAPEYIGDAGLLVNPWDVSQLSEAMVKLLTDRSLWAMKSREAVRMARMFSMERMASGTLKVYKEALASG
jgi:glycosyltransferase involved in cell wall biosynthesis